MKNWQEEQRKVSVWAARHAQNNHWLEVVVVLVIFLLFFLYTEWRHI